MQRTFAFALAAVAALALTLATEVDAKRLGGGKSFGSQRQSIAPPAAPSAPSATTPGAAANPVMPAQPGMAAAKTAAPAAASGASRWLGPIAGLAAGLGLAALLSHFGLPEGMGSILLIGLLGVAAFVVLKMLFGRRSTPAGAPLQYAGARSGSGEPTLSAPPPRGAFEPAFGNSAGTGAATASRFPPGFDAAAFAQQAKQQFNRLQAAYDRNDREALADVLTPEMLGEVTRDIEARGAHVETTVEALDAEVLQATTEGDRHWVSVRFTGRTREDGGPAQPLDEIWNLAKPVAGSSGWQLAGIQQAATA